MNKSTSGQSMLEYAFITALVVLGVVVMGPYVLRSINAHFKLWDEQVHDSFTEQIVQAPVSDVPDLPLNCSCTVIGSCGGSSLATSDCFANQREYTTHCLPQGCNGSDGSFNCVTDPSCCTGWQPLGCGTFPCPPGGCPCPLAPSSCPNGSSSGPQTMSTPTSNNCYFGYALQGQECGSSVVYQCSYDHPPCPVPSCQGQIDQTNSQCCPNSAGTTCGPPLTTNQGVNYVAPGNCTPGGGTPCQYYCNNGGTYDSSTGLCSAPPPPLQCTGIAGTNPLCCSSGTACSLAIPFNFCCGNPCDSSNVNVGLCKRADPSYDTIIAVCASNSRPTGGSIMTTSPDGQTCSSSGGSHYVVGIICANSKATGQCTPATANCSTGLGCNLTFFP